MLLLINYLSRALLGIRVIKFIISFTIKSFWAGIALALNLPRTCYNSLASYEIDYNSCIDICLEVNSKLRTCSRAQIIDFLYAIVFGLKSRQGEGPQDGFTSSQIVT
jgi:hypothetical protein